jgi:hypothetical protein
MGGVFFKPLNPVPLLLVLGFGVSHAAAEEPGMRAVWEYLAGSQPVMAQVGLDETTDGDPRVKALAQAAIDLARPPIREGDWNHIEPVLAQLAAGEDEVAARALYLQARMHQVHKVTPDHARAEALYRELDRRWPGSHWAQLGLVKLGLVKLYAMPEPVEPRARIAVVLALLDRIEEPMLRRDLLLQIGWAGLFYELPYAEVLPHLIAAEAIGGMLGITPEDLVIQIGELSFRTGELEQARHYFQRFLMEFPTNSRKFNVQCRLEEVELALAAKGSES